MSFKSEHIITSTIKEQVYNIIKENILNGIIKPGSWLQEQEIAENLHVSRSPVREALKELSGEGLLNNIPNKGVFVKQLTSQDIIEMFELRILIEQYCIEKAIINASDEDFNGLDEIYIKLEESYSKHDCLLYSKLDIELHNKIIYLSGNKLIYDVNQKMFMMLQPFRSLSLANKKRFNESLKEHKNIIDSIKRRDVKSALEYNLKHLNLSKIEILSCLEKSNSSK